MGLLRKTCILGWADAYIVRIIENQLLNTVLHQEINHDGLHFETMLFTQHKARVKLLSTLKSQELFFFRFFAIALLMQTERASK